MAWYRVSALSRRATSPFRASSFGYFFFPLPPPLRRHFSRHLGLNFLLPGRQVTKGLPLGGQLGRKLGHLLRRVRAFSTSSFRVSVMLSVFLSIAFDTSITGDDTIVNTLFAVYGEKVFVGVAKKIVTGYNKGG